jgi:NADPH:quinone reductase-like Zn-dependent oxidoreductase
MVDMSAFVEQKEFSDAVDLEVVDRPEPHAGPGDIRIRVSAAGLNPADWKIATDPQRAAAFGLTAPTGFGSDVAGVIDEVGDAVTGWAVGDHVFGTARGFAVAEHVVLPVDTADLHRTPDGLDDATAGALPIAGRTASAAVASLKLHEGDTVLIGGAAGGVGVLAVQLARRAGATVIATASEGNHEFLRELGAIPTTYGDGLADRVRALAPGGVDAAIDLQGTETAEAAAALGVPGERIALIAAPPTAGGFSTGGRDAASDALDVLAQQLADGALVLPISGTYPIERISDAVAELRSGHVRGKLVVTV